MTTSRGAIEGIDASALRDLLQQMKQQMEMLQKTLDEIESRSNEQAEETEEIQERLDKAELHTATDKLWEAYWHQRIFGDNLFVTLGGQYYDYEYTGSGNPMGKPVKISDLTALDALNAVNDEVWVGYLSATLRF